MSKEPGRKLIQILRLLTEGILTINEITDRVDFSESYVEEIVKRGEKEGYIKKHNKVVIRKPGRPKARKSERIKPEKKTGRPPYYYCLTGDGKWLIRLDPEVRHIWMDKVEKTYEELTKHTLFDCYANLVYGIQEHQELGEYQRPHYFMDGYLQLKALSPFIYRGEREVEKVTQLYDELIEVIKVCVRSEHIPYYYKTLAQSVPRLKGILDRHYLLMDKLKTLPEVQEYLEKQSSTR